jgi:hypothetical protein
MARHYILLFVALALTARSVTGDVDVQPRLPPVLDPILGLIDQVIPPKPDRPGPPSSPSPLRPIAGTYAAYLARGALEIQMSGPDLGGGVEVAREE